MSFNLTTTVYFHQQVGKVYVELLKEGNAYPTEGALCLHHQLNHWQLLIPHGHFTQSFKNAQQKERHRKHWVMRNLPVAKADEKQTMETTNGRPGVSADPSEEPEARDSSAYIAKMLKPTN